MDTQKLYRVANDILTEVTEGDVSVHLANLSSYISQNTAAGYESATETRAVLNGVYDSSVTNQYAPTYLEIVNLLGATDYVGAGGKAALTRILDGSPLELTTKLQEYVAAFNELVPKLKKLIDSLDEVGITPYESDKYEIGYVIPADLDNLGGVAKRLIHYNKFIELSSAIVGEEDNTVHLSRVSNGTLEFFVVGSVYVAKVVDTVLKRVIVLYQEIQKIKKVSAEIEGIKANTESTKAKTLQTKTETLASLVAMEKEISNSFVEDTVDEVMANYRGNGERKEEISGQLGVTIKLLLKDIQSGIKVEVTPPEAGETEEADGGEATAVRASITSTNTDLIGLYSLPKEELRLPAGLTVTKAEEKKLDEELASKPIPPKAKAEKPAATKKPPKTKK